MKPLWMLDTNTVSHIIRGHTGALRRLVTSPMDHLVISAVTKGELLFGLARRPQATKLARSVEEFLRRIGVMAWDDAAAESYGTLRASLEKSGTVLGSLDCMIAAHALALKAILVSNDQAFLRVKGLKTEDWTL